jgi:hypothetical protein
MSLLDQVKRYLRKLSRSEIRTRAAAAQVWLRDETFNVAIAKMRHDCHQTWLKAGTVAEREACWTEMHRIGDFVRNVQLMVVDDKIKTLQDQRAARARVAP